MAAAPDDAKVFMAKWDIKDGFWRMDCADGEEWNFAYVLPLTEGAPIRLIIPTSLQMGWVESPPYNCAASETTRDVATWYVNTPVGSLPPHNFIGYSIHDKDIQNLPNTNDEKDFRYFIDVYVDNFIPMVIPTTQKQIKHVVNAVMYGIHNVFTPTNNDADDPISLKKTQARGRYDHPPEGYLGLCFQRSTRP
jgi:hypothetical protein